LKILSLKILNTGYGLITGGSIKGKILNN